MHTPGPLVSTKIAVKAGSVPEPNAWRCLVKCGGTNADLHCGGSVRMKLSTEKGTGERSESQGVPVGDCGGRLR